jgi:hypothetical protein
MLRTAMIVAILLAGQAAAQCENPPLLASDGLGGDAFGNSCSIWQDRALVTSIYDDGIGIDSGSAYIYELQGDVWVQKVKLIASDTTELDRFGHSCGIFGDACIIGARYNQDLGYGTGSAYIFERVGGIWSQTAYLVAATTEQSGALFGQSCDIANGVAVVGADTEDGPAGANQGAVHVFKKQAGVWSESQKISASDGKVNGKFGEAVALEGNRLVVGSRNTVGAFPGAGEVYVYESSGGVYAETQKLTAPTPQGGALFGEHVAISGNTIAVASLLEDSLGTDGGAVYVFEHNGTSWVQTAQLLPETTYPAKFGSLDISGDTIIVGAGFDADKGTDAGAAYRFHKTDGVWKQIGKFSASDTQAGEWFGAAVSVWGDRALITAQIGLNEGGLLSGKAYIFDELNSILPYGQGTPGTGAITPKLTLTGCTEAGENLHLAITHGKPGALAFMLLGLRQASLPLAGCTLLTFPLLPLQVALPLDGSGAIGFDTLIPATLVSPVTIDLQTFVVDAGGPKGFSSTAATEITVGG